MKIKILLISCILLCAVSLAYAYQYGFGFQPGLNPGGSFGGSPSSSNWNSYGSTFGRSQYGRHPTRYGWTYSVDGNCAFRRCPRKTYCTYKLRRCCGYRKHCWYKVTCRPRRRFGRRNPE